MIKHLCKLVWNRKRINLLIMVEIFFSFLVTFGVTVFAVYYTDNYRQPLGFNYDNVWAVALDAKSGSTPGEQNNLLLLATTKQILSGVREFSEVESAAPLWGAPYWNGDWSGDRKLKDGTSLEMGHNETTDELKELLGLNVIRGRWFSKEDDGVTNYRPVVINQKLARAVFGDEDPIGKDISNPEDSERDDNKRKEERVIGVIDDFRKQGEFAALRGTKFFRINFNDEKQQMPVYLLVKVRPGTPAAFEEKLIGRMQAEAKDWSFNIKPLAEMRAGVFQQYLIPMTAFALVAGFLLIMVGLGLTGVLWLTVTQRTKEIGLRRAKGATRQRIYKQILGELFITTTAGLIIGVLVVVQFPLLNLMGFASPKVYAISVALSLALIYLLTLICGLYPSRLATKIHPAEALHYE